MEGGEGKTRLVVAVVSTNAEVGRAELRGIERAATRAGWALETIDPAQTGLDLSPFAPLIAAADGVIVRGGSKVSGVLPMMRPGTPLVQMDTDFAPSGKAADSPRGIVLCDHDAVAVAAADELLALGRQCHVFVPALRPRTWTDYRAKPFIARILAAGREAFLYEPQTEWGWAKERDALGGWLSSLPRPMAIFAGNDLLAKFTLGACRSAGLDVPRDAAILGTDDDGTLCLSTTPALSSIRLDFEGAGRMAVERLAALMARRKSTRPARPTIVRFGVVGISRRGSTRGGAAETDPRIAAGLDFIADHHSDPLLGVRDVAAAMGTGRRQAERLFGSTGKTIRQQIEDTRMERVRSLLATTPLSIRAIAEECGFSSGPYLSHLIKKRLGVSPGEWRRERAGQN